MKLITYTLSNGAYYRDNQEITEDQIRTELSSDQFRKLKREKEIRVRNKGQVIIPKKEKKSKDDKLFEKYNQDYKLDIGKYRTGDRLEVWRKNKKYGYYNFVAYIESEDEFKETVIKDIKEQSSKDKVKKSSSIIDEDI